MTLSTGGFRQVVAFPPAPIATGWSDPCREGLAPSQEPCLSTAHDFITTTPVFKFSVHTAGPLGSNGEALRQPIFLIRYPSLVIEPLPRLVSRFIAETSEKDRL
jgi:hypothetical protein